jgi:hypothetical protein
VNITVLFDLLRCSLFEICQHFGKTFCLHFRDIKLNLLAVRNDGKLLPGTLPCARRRYLELRWSIVKYCVLRVSIVFAVKTCNCP